MSGETIVVTGTTKVLEANGGLIANNSVVQADDASYSVATDGGGYPDAEFVISATFATAPTEGTTLVLMARPLDIDGTSDAEAPELARPTRFVGIFEVNDVTSAQYIALVARDVPRKADYYLGNNATGQSVTSGWTLKVTPLSYKAAA